MLTVAGIVAVVAVINAVLPSVDRTSGALVSTASIVDDRLGSQVEIVHATGDNGATTADLWVKNVGSTVIQPLDRIDMFFGPEGQFVRIPYGGPSCASPCWEYSLENDTTWAPTATLHIIIHLEDGLQTNTIYYAKVVAPNGSSDAKYFTV